jgi:hypothetical protein
VRVDGGSRGIKFRPITFILHEAQIGFIPIILKRKDEKNKGVKNKYTEVGKQMINAQESNRA